MTLKMHMVLEAGPIRDDGNASVTTDLRRTSKQSGDIVFPTQKRGRGENM